jgi:hypothetical protein
VGVERALDPHARAITLAMRRPERALAFAAIVPAPLGAPACCVIGPVAAALGEARVTDPVLDVFAGELVHLADLLPGPPPRAICVLGDRRAYAAAGFVAIDGAPGWTWRRTEPLTADEQAAIGAALPEIARGADVLATWSGQRDSAASAR